MSDVQGEGVGLVSGGVDTSQYVMGNGHMGIPSPNRMTDKHLWKYYLPTSSLAGVNIMQMPIGYVDLT